MGRHSAGTAPSPERRRSLRWLAVPVVVAAAAALTAVLLWVNHNAPSPVAKHGAAPGAGSGQATSNAGCSRAVTVVSAASFAPTLRRVAAGIAHGPDCVAVHVVLADGQEARAAVARDHADAWIPDNTSWIDLPGPARLATGGTAGTVLATSPVMFVTRHDAPALPANDRSWLGLARAVAQSGRWQLTVRDPAGSGDGMVAVGGLADAVLDSDGPLVSALDLLRTWTRATTVTSARPALPQRADQVGLVPEYALLRAGNLGGYTVVPPTDGTSLLYYAWYPTAAAQADPTKAAALHRLYQALTGKSAAAARAVGDLRGPTWPSPPPRAAARAGLPNPTAAAMPTISEHFMYHVMATWHPQMRRSNMLIVIDVSGSMAAAAPGASTPKIDLVRRGLSQVASLLPDSALLGLWQFGSQLRPPQDWQQLAAPAPLTSGQRHAIAAAGAGLRPKVTGTGLYDTILGAYRYQQAHYQKSMPNEVVLFTDGINQDDPGSISLQQLHDRLAATDPGKRVQLSIFGIGDAVPATKLNAALQPVGGQVDLLHNPDEVIGGFVHAVSGALSGVPG